MADKKISALTAATTPLAGTEVLPIVQSGVTVKVSVDNLTAGKPVSMSNLTYTGTLTGSTGIANIGSGQFYKDASGNVGIGTTTPTRKLDVVGNGAFTTSVDGTTLTVAGGGVGGQSGQILQTNTYAGTPTPNKYLRVDSSGQWQILNSAYSNTIISITNAGAANQGNNSSTWTVVSDARIKQNIRPITDAIGKICALKPCHFEYKTRPDKIKTNFIAQEFEEIFPDHVSEDVPSMEFKELFVEGEKMKSIDVDLIPYLTKAIQEQQALIIQLQANVTKLEASQNALNKVGG